MYLLRMFFLISSSWSKLLFLCERSNGPCQVKEVEHSIGDVCRETWKIWGKNTRWPEHLFSNSNIFQQSLRDGKSLVKVICYIITTLFLHSDKKPEWSTSDIEGNYCVENLFKQFLHIVSPDNKIVLLESCSHMLTYLCFWIIALLLLLHLL